MVCYTNAGNGLAISMDADRLYLRKHIYKPSGTSKAQAMLKVTSQWEDLLPCKNI